MNTAAALLTGAGAGAGIWLIARGWRPPRPSLSEAIHHLRHPPAPPITTIQDQATGFAGKLGRPIAQRLAELGDISLIPTRIRSDLAILGRSPDVHLAEKTFLALVGLVFAPALALILTIGGLSVPIVVPLWVALLLAAAGFFGLDLGVHADAQKRRREFRQALSTYLDLTTVSLAGGAGVETALHDAAEIGDGWVFERIRGALQGAHRHRQPPWASLAQLGSELGVTELEELAASIGLAGTEGAKVRATLATKAASLRTHELAEAETTAQAASERMSLPVVLLFAGFLAFIAFPAITRILTLH